MHFPCVATKTITLAVDAYEKLRRAKRDGESFTEVVRRGVWGDSPLTGASLRDYLRNGGTGISEKYLASIEEASGKGYASF